MSLYAAIDLHSSNRVLAVMDGEDKALLQCRTPNDPPRILADWHRISPSWRAWPLSRPATGTGWSMG